MRIVLVFYFLFFGIFWGKAQSGFFDVNKIRDIKITFKEKNWDKKLDSMMALGTNKRLEASVTIDGIKYNQVGIRYKGNSSYNNVRQQGKEKLPLNLDADFKIKTQKFPGGIESIKLSNMFRDPSYLREVLAYELAGQYIISPKANFAKVTVNGKYLGLYANTESIDEHFIKNEFKDNDGILFKCDPNWDSPELLDCPKGDKASLQWQGEDSSCYFGNYELKSDYGYKELLDLIRTLNQNPSKIESVLDVNSVLWMHAFNHTLVNLDSYSGRLCHNYYLFKPKNGVFIPIIWDLNLAFGGFRMDGTKSMTDEELFNYPPLQHCDNPLRPLISKLCANPLYKKMLLAYIKTIFNEQFQSQKLIKRTDQLSKMIDLEVKNDRANLYGYGVFKENIERKVTLGNVIIPGLKELIKKRSSYLSRTIIDNSPILSNPLSIRDSIGVKFSVQSENTNQVYLFYSIGKQQQFKSVKMSISENSDGKYWTYRLPKTSENEKLKYFFVSENETSASVLPEKSSIEAFEN